MIFILLLVAVALAVASGLAVHLAQKAQSQRTQAAPLVSAAPAGRVFAGERTLLMDEYQRARLTDKMLTNQMLRQPRLIPQRKPPCQTPAPGPSSFA